MSDAKDLWGPLADEAVAVFIREFEQERDRQLGDYSGGGGSRIAIVFQTAVTRAFDIAGGSLVREAREVAASRQIASHLGEPEKTADALVAPLLHRAINSLPQSEDETIGTIRKMGEGMLRSGAERLKAQLGSEIRAQLDRIAQADEEAARRKTGDRWSLLANISTVASAATGVLGLVLGYIAGKANLLTTVWEAIVNAFR